jgi:hypothetical protein
MASLMNAPIQPLAPEDAASVGPAQAYTSTKDALSSWVDAQRAKAVEQGLWDPDTGFPTLKGMHEAAQQYGGALVAGTSAPGVRAFHGSPHDFEAFDAGKIGTGEGAQAYGVGAGYLAGNEGVARGYRDKLAPGSQLAVNGVPVSGMPDSVRGIAQWMERTGKSPEDLIPITQQRIVKAREDAKSLGLDPGALVDEHQATLDAIERLRGAQVSRIPSGHMYEVKVNADPERFLHWDKPLSEQSQYVRDALNNLPANVRDNLVGVLRGALDNPGGLASKRFATGEQIYKDLSDAHSRMSGDPTLYETPQGKIVAASARGAADALQQAGIPGIRYLDQGSRGAGEGSHNYVVFDANTMNIIRRYGLAGLMAAGGAAATQQQQPNALQAQ